MSCIYVNESIISDSVNSIFQSTKVNLVRLIDYIQHYGIDQPILSILRDKLKEGIDTTTIDSTYQSSPKVITIQLLYLESKLLPLFKQTWQRITSINSIKATSSLIQHVQILTETLESLEELLTEFQDFVHKSENPVDTYSIGSHCGNCDGHSADSSNYSYRYSFLMNELWRCEKSLSSWREEIECDITTEQYRTDNDEDDEDNDDVFGRFSYMEEEFETRNYVLCGPA